MVWGSWLTRSSLTNTLAVASLTAASSVYPRSSCVPAHPPPRPLPSSLVRQFPSIDACSFSLTVSSAGIIREPLQGLPSTCPIGSSPDSPELDLQLWVASPETTIANFLHARRVPGSAFLPHTRVVCLPGFTTTVREEIAALEEVAGPEAVARITFEADETNRRVVQSWPARFDNAYALGLGFAVDEGGMVPIVRQFRDQLRAGAV